jgi:aspartate kinase
MKFGGTSVGDASSIAKVVEIIRTAASESKVVVVVSAMSGVTNKLIEAATQAESGNRKAVDMIFEDLRKQHEAAVSVLIHSAAERSRIGHQIGDIFEEGDHLCQGTIQLRELTLRARDSISSLGERLSAPLLAAALADCGMASEAIEATELVVTDSYHGGAEPWMNLTRERSEARLRPLLEQGIVPVITGFIGATAEGVLTTLGRGGSDYSATILGAALDADEVIIWTDVDGVLTADPRQVSDASTIPEISYREAAELAQFGARVLHPKTLRPLMQSDISLWIRNTFSPERPGTKITPTGSLHVRGVKALSAISEVALITVGGPGIVGKRDVLGRTFTATAAVRADVLLISQSSSQNDICFVVPSAVANRTVEALRREFAQDLEHETVEHITIDPTIAIVAVVGEKMRGIPGIVGRTFAALGRENVSIIAIAQGSSECNISVVVAQKDMKAALLATHAEFQLGALHSQPLPAKTAPPTAGKLASGAPHWQATAPGLAESAD